jgi:hypothetical protein
MVSIPAGWDIAFSHQRSGSLMALRRLIAATTLLGFGLCLASCGSFVADHWPHWAGGMPADVPPRPGTPGYAEFIAHGQAPPEAKQEPTASAAAVQTGTQQVPPAPAIIPQQPAPLSAVDPNNDTRQDSSVVKGGLY